MTPSHRSHRLRPAGKWNGTRILAACRAAVDDDHAGGDLSGSRTGCGQRSAAHHSVLPRGQVEVAGEARGARERRGSAVQHDVDGHHDLRVFEWESDSA